MQFIYCLLYWGLFVSWYLTFKSKHDFSYYSLRFFSWVTNFIGSYSSKLRNTLTTMYQLAFSRKKSIWTGFNIWKRHYGSVLTGTNRERWTIISVSGKHWRATTFHQTLTYVVKYRHEAKNKARQLFTNDWCAQLRRGNDRMMNGP